MRLVKLHHRNGECIYVNPAQIIAVEPYPLYETPKGSSRIERVGMGAKLYFALLGRAESDVHIEYTPYSMIVTEAPKDVAGLFLDPLVG